MSVEKAKAELIKALDGGDTLHAQHKFGAWIKEIRAEAEMKRREGKIQRAAESAMRGGPRPLTDEERAVRDKQAAEEMLREAEDAARKEAAKDGG